MTVETLYATSLTSGAVATSANALGAPNGTWTTDVDNTNWTARFAMGNPTLKDPNGTHTITVRARKETGTGTPTLTSITLYNGSTSLGAIGAGNWSVTSTTGQDISATFNADTLLSGVNVDNVEVELVATSSGGGPSARSTVQIDGITWSGDFTALALQGSGTGSWSATGSATGVRSSLGSATGTWSVTGSATGDNGEVSLPGFIDGWVEPEAAGSWTGPIRDSNGNLYRVLEENLAAGNHPAMVKSSDGGATWARVAQTTGPGYDDGGSPLAGAYNDLESAWARWDSTNKIIWLTYMKAQSRWWGVAFRTSDHATLPDSWDRSTFATSSGQDQFATVASESAIASEVLSNGNVRAFIRGEPQGGFEALLHRLRTTAWDTGSTYITDANISIVRPATVLGSSDTVYLFYRDHTNGQVRYRTVSSSGTVSASARVDSGGAGTTTAYENNVVPPVFYSDGGTDVAVVAFVNASNILRTVEVRGGVVGSEQVVNANAVALDPAALASQGPAAALACDPTTKTLYAIWADAASGDLYYAERPNGGTWSARTLLAAGTTINWVYAGYTVKPNGGRVISYTWDDASTDDDSNIKYNEIALVALGQGSATGSWTVSGSASGTRRAVSEWTASVQATTGTGTPTGSGTGSWTVSGVASGARVSQGVANNFWTVTGTASGARESRASAVGAWEVTGSATGTRSSRGSGTGAWATAGTAVGSRASEGSVGGAWAISGAANGATAHRGTATGTWNVAGSASGSMPAVPGSGGSATGAWTVSGSAQGVHVSSGLGTGSWSAAGVATGSRGSAGTGVGTWTATGSAQGSAPGIPGAGGSSTGFWSVSGSASGQRISSGGAASATWSVSGAADGTRPASGSAVGTWSVSGTAQSAGARAGSATGSWSVSGWADGVVDRSGAAVGGWVVAGDASGGSPEVPPSTGSASGLVEWSGAATGERISLGNALGAVVFSAVAVGITSRSGTAVPGAWVFTGTASGFSNPIVPAVRPVAWLGSIGGQATIAYKGGTAIITSP